jgi:hypothetical protein
MANVDADTLIQLERIDQAARKLYEAVKGRGARRTSAEKVEYLWLDLEAALFSCPPHTPQRPQGER